MRQTRELLRDLCTFRAHEAMYIIAGGAFFNGVVCGVAIGHYLL